MSSPQQKKSTSFKLKQITPKKTRVLDVFSGEKSVFILLNNGELYAFGEGSYGELGHGEAVYRLTTPKKV